MPQSRQGATALVTGTANVYKGADLATSVDFIGYDVGMVQGEPGGDSTFLFHVYDNDVELDYELLEGIDQEGPWDVLDSGSIAISADPTIPTLTKSGIFYGGVLRLNVKHATSSGTFSIKIISK